MSLWPVFSFGAASIARGLGDTPTLVALGLTVIALDLPWSRSAWPSAPRNVIRTILPVWLLALPTAALLSATSYNFLRML